MRQIDGDFLYAALENIDQQLRQMDTDPARSMAQMVQFCMGIVQDTPTIPPPANEPLTLEELREMCGEPVYFRCFGRRRMGPCTDRRRKRLFYMQKQVMDPIRKYPFVRL